MEEASTNVALPQAHQRTETERGRRAASIAARADLQVQPCLSKGDGIRRSLRSRNRGLPCERDPWTSAHFQEAQAAGPECRRSRLLNHPKSAETTTQALPRCHSYHLFAHPSTCSSPFLCCFYAVSSIILRLCQLRVWRRGYRAPGLTTSPELGIEQVLRPEWWKGLMLSRQCSNEP